MKPPNSEDRTDLAGRRLALWCSESPNASESQAGRLKPEE
jgi:hypothetical protein